MKQKRFLSVIALCVVFLLSIVVLAILALYFIFSSVFTTDIKLILIASSIALIVFAIYLFSLKLSSITNTKDITERARAYRIKRDKKRYHVPQQQGTQNSEQSKEQTDNSKDFNTTQHTEEEKPALPSKPPVFEKKEYTVEKKTYKPVFGPSSDNKDD